jgi:hypothetical protein
VSGGWIQVSVSRHRRIGFALIRTRSIGQSERGEWLTNCSDVPS